MQEEVQYEVSRLGDAIEPILLAVMGALVLLLMLGIFLPLWDLGQLAQQTWRAAASTRSLCANKRSRRARGHR